MNAPILKSETMEFSTYARHILLTIKEALEKSSLTEVQILAIFIQLSQATTKQELKDIIHKLSIKYPILTEIDFYEQEENQLDFDNALQLIISSLIKAGKAKEADDLMKKSHTYEKNLHLLMQEYQEYFNPKNNDY